MNSKGTMVDAPYTRNLKAGASKQVKDPKTGLVMRIKNPPAINNIKEPYRYAINIKL
jgi:hypothetical protein